MYSAVSGVQAHQTRLDVVGNNIANVNTVGYKAARTTFFDQLSQTVKGATRPQDGMGGVNPVQAGLGVRVGSVTTQHTQGALQQTGRPSDLSVQGNGFFLVGDGNTAAYTRDGAFTLDADGSLVSATTGMKLLGWQADASGNVVTSGPVTPKSSIAIPIGTLTSVRATGNVAFAGNLNSGATAPYVRTAQIFDSLGNPHNVTFSFAKTGTNQWTATPTSPAGAFSAAPTLTFNANGTLASSTGSPLTFTLAAPAGAASPMTLALDFSKMTQLAGESTGNAVSQDGFPFGTLQSYSIGDDGTITGIFSNGLNRDLGRVALAQFANPAGLDKMGSNLFRPTTNSGAAQVTPPGVSGAGRVSAGFLEQSNVNLADEFTNMIITQRGFQANTRMVTASDEILQDLLQMKR
jgi:flagellar hook protein FlgE